MASDSNAKNEKLVEAIADMEQDFAQWYTDVVKKAELCDYSSLKGFVIIRPYGFALWENIQRYTDDRFKESGHENVSMPLLIPESLLQKEKDHVEGFAPEVAWVTHGGQEKLQERLCVRPTSEVLFCDHYKNVVQSYRDLPKLYNQWGTVVRWEKTTRPFLRTREFHWQEGHTCHATAEEAQEETIRMLKVYADVCENFLAIPVIGGKKTDKEKFAGARETYTIESMMHDGKSLQGGTSHNFGDGFAKAFGIQYTDRDGSLKYVHQTSWGLSARTIGAIIMVHGDNNGLVLPPKAAPIQLVIIPIGAHKANVLEKAEELRGRLKAKFRVKLDDSDKNPGWKFSEYEMKGVPLRLELGPKDLEQGSAVLVRRDTREKISVPLENLEAEAEKLLADIHRNLFERALSNRESKTYTALTLDEFIKTADEKPGFIKAMWCGSEACEDELRESAGTTSRCIPFEQEKLSNCCVCCGKPADKMVLWGKAY